MADTKISALPAATTPLAGTEVLPIVQGGTTDKVSIANVTAGREVSMSKLLVDSSGAVAGRISRSGGIVANSCVEFFNGTQTWNVGVSGSNFFGVNYNNSAIDSALLRVSTAGDVTVSTGNVVMSTSGKGIDFSATPGTGTSELLADYEEGTFTPVLAFAGGSTGITYTTQLGRYTKIGNRVNFNITIDLSNKGSSAGGASISGLPFTVAESTVAMAFISNISAVGTIPQFLANSTVVDLYYQSTGSNAQYTNGNFNNNSSVLISGTYRV